MSQENVDFVLGLYPGPEVADYIPVFQDDGLWTGFAEGLRPFVLPGFPTVWHEFGAEKRYEGLAGFRAFMLDWTGPWVAYGIEHERAIDLGDRVLVLNQDRGRRADSEQEVRGRVAALWTLVDGKIGRLDAYMTQTEALKAVGVEE
jgi:ketosteroid isomerase-like protein